MKNKKSISERLMNKIMTTIIAPQLRNEYLSLMRQEDHKKMTGNSTITFQASMRASSFKWSPWLSRAEDSITLRVWKTTLN